MVNQDTNEEATFYYNNWLDANQSSADVNRNNPKTSYKVGHRACLAAPVLWKI